MKRFVKYSTVCSFEHTDSATCRKRSVSNWLLNTQVDNLADEKSLVLHLEKGPVTHRFFGKFWKE